jgi:putative ABC transport system permease protein
MLARLSLKNLIHEKVKFVAGLLSVGLAIALILTLLGIYLGAITQARSVPENSGADYWVVQEGTRDMFHTVSVLPSGLNDELNSLAAVDQVSAAINAPTNIHINGNDKTTGVIAYDTATGLLGPPEIVEGGSISRLGEIVVDRALARAGGLKIGQTLEIFGQNFTVVGLSGGSNALAFQYIFIGLDDYRKLQDNSERFVNYYLIKSNAPQSQLQADVEQIVPGSTVRTTAQVANDNLKVIEDSFLDIILLLVLVGAAVGTLIISITVYNATTERARDYAILKAIGARAGRLRGVAIIQSVITAAGGFVIGLALYGVVQLLAPNFIPQVELKMGAAWVVAVAAFALTMAILGAVIPIRKINRVDPVEVFNA